MHEKALRRNLAEHPPDFVRRHRRVRAQRGHDIHLAGILQRMVEIGGDFARAGMKARKIRRQKERPVQAFLLRQDCAIQRGVNFFIRQPGRAIGIEERCGIVYLFCISGQSDPARPPGLRQGSRQSARAASPTSACARAVRSSLRRTVCEWASPARRRRSYTAARRQLPTARAPIIAPSPIVTPERITASKPIHTSLPTTISPLIVPCGRDVFCVQPPFSQRRWGKDTLKASASHGWRW